MASVRKTPLSQYWQAVITLEDGTRTNRSTKQTDKRKAFEVATEMERTFRAARQGKLAEGQLLKTFNELMARLDVDPISSETVEEYLRRWLKGKDNPSTNERYTKTVDLFLVSLGRKAQGMLNAVTHKDVLKFMQERKDKGFAPNTIRVDIKSLNNAFNLARKVNLIEKNPVEHALTLVPLRASDSMSKEPFTLDDVNKLLTVADSEWKTMVLLGFYTGARMGDCAAMAWGNVKTWKGVNILDFIEEKNEGRRKTAAQVVVPIHPTLQAHLDTLPRFSPTAAFSPTLAGKATGGAHGLSRTFHDLMIKAGVDPKFVQGKGKRQFSMFSFHSFRHTLNSNLANSDITQEMRMAITGHTTESVNTGYTHFDIPKLQSVIAKLPALQVA